jgi:hypothetical protein
LIEPNILTPLLPLSQARDQQKQAAKMPIKLKNPLLGQDLSLQNSMLNTSKKKSLDEQTQLSYYDFN